jgi:hypothetical protein
MKTGALENSWQSPFWQPVNPNIKIYRKNIGDTPFLCDKAGIYVVHYPACILPLFHKVTETMFQSGSD